MHPSDITHHSFIAGELCPSSSLSPQHIWQTFKRWALPPGTARSPYRRGTFALGEPQILVWSRPCPFFPPFIFTREVKFLICWQHHGDDASQLPLFMHPQFILLFYDVCTFKIDWVWDSWQSQSESLQPVKGPWVCIPGRDSKGRTSSMDRFSWSITAARHQKNET